MKSTQALETVRALCRRHPELEGPLKEVSRALADHQGALAARRGPGLYERVCLGIGAAGIVVVTVSFLYLVIAH